MPEHQNAAPQWPAGSIIELGQMDDKPLQWVVIRAHGNDRLLLSLKYIAQRRIGRTSTSKWANSELREWLNTDFFYTAFALEDQQLCQINGDYISLLSEEELKHWQPLPDCIVKDDQPWWLCSCSKDSDNDAFFDCVSLTDTRVWLSSKRPNETAYVRPIVAISLDPSKTAVDRNVFHSFDCPFCGTENADYKQPCTCCGYSPGRQFNTQQGHYSGTGCLIVVALLLLIVLGGMSLYGGPIGLVVFTLIAVCTIPGIIRLLQGKRELQEAKKYENASDSPILLHTCRNNHEHTAAIYHNARLLQKYAANARDYNHAANMYALIPDYQDAVAQREACLKAAKGSSTGDIYSEI